MEKTILRHLDFYTDGAWSSKSDMGGWASVCVEDETVIDIQQGFEAYTTNNRMEIAAFVKALEILEHVASPEHTSVTIWTDSTYVMGAFNVWYVRWIDNGWKTADRRDVENQDLLKPGIAKLIKLKSHFGEFNISKVDSHIKEKDPQYTIHNKYNNYADKIAVAQRKILEEA